LVGSATASPYAASANTTTLANGSHSFYAKAYDAAGNSAVSASSSVTVSNTTPGQLQWVRNMTTSTQILPCAVVIDHASNRITAGGFMGSADFGAGSMNGAGSLDVFIAKYAADGTCLWSRAFGARGDDRAYGLTVDSQNNIIVTGYFEYSVDFGGVTLTANDPFGWGVSDIFVAKYSPAGSLIWAVRMGGSSSDFGQGLAVDSSDNVYLAASFSGTATFGTVSLATVSGGPTIALVKIAATTGATAWAKAYGTCPQGDTPNALTIDRNGDLLITGNSGGATDLGAGPTAGGLFIAKYSTADGSCKWARAQGGGNGQGITTDPGTGNVFVTGSSPGSLDYGGGAINGGFFIAAYSTAGSYLWSYANGGAGDSSLAVAVDGAGNLSITGQSASVMNFNGTWTSGSGWFVANYNVTGSAPVFRWARRTTASSFGSGVAYDSSGHLVVCGAFTGIMDFGGVSLSSSTYDNGFMAQYSK
jgi:hypothetical protein